MGREAKDILVDYLLIDFGSVKPDRQSPEDRLPSKASESLGNHIIDLLKTSAISPTFRKIIATHVRVAHANGTTVPDIISPETLELTEGNSGIFDPKRAPEIEYMSLHCFADSIIDSLADVCVGITRTVQSHLNMFEVWARDYREHHCKDPLVDSQRRILYRRFSTDPSYLRNPN